MIQLLTAACEQWSHRTTGHSCHVQRLPQAIVSDVIYDMTNYLHTQYCTGSNKKSVTRYTVKTVYCDSTH